MSGRIRSIKPEWLEDERLALAPPEARVLSVALMLIADDHGNGRMVPQILASRIFPASPGIFANALDTLQDTRFIELYQCEGQTYFSIRNWKKHQRVDKPGKPHVPGPLDKGVEKIPGSLANVPGSLAPDLRPTTYEPTNETKGRSSRAKDSEPTPGALVRKAFLDGYAARFPKSKPYPWGAREAGQAKNLLKTLPLAEALELIDAWFRWPNKRAIDASLMWGTGPDCFVLKWGELRGDLSHPERRKQSAVVDARMKQLDTIAQDDDMLNRMRIQEQHTKDPFDDSQWTDETGRMEQAQPARPRAPEASPGGTRGVADGAIIRSDVAAVVQAFGSVLRSEPSGDNQQALHGGRTPFVGGDSDRTEAKTGVARVDIAAAADGRATRGRQGSDEGGDGCGTWQHKPKNVATAMPGKRAT